MTMLAIMEMVVIVSISKLMLVVALVVLMHGGDLAMCGNAVI